MSSQHEQEMREDGVYTPEEEARYSAYADKALIVYEAGMDRLEELAPDLHEIVLGLEPVSLVPYREVGLASFGLFEDEEGREELGVVLNVESFSTLTTDEAAFVLAHEAEHVRRDHQLLEKLSDPADNRRRNVAQDVTINDLLLKRGLPRPPLETMPCGELVGLKGGDCAELDWPEVLELLPAEIPSDPDYYLRRLAE